MKFLIDAQLPRRLARRLNDHGHDALHTLDLPDANQTKDQEINQISVRESRVVVTKDSDFVDSLLLHRQPHKLLLVTTGNIRNAELEHLLFTNLDRIVSSLIENDYVELSRSAVVLRD